MKLFFESSLVVLFLVVIFWYPENIWVTVFLIMITLFRILPFKADLKVLTLSKVLQRDCKELYGRYMGGFWIATATRIINYLALNTVVAIAFVVLFIINMTLSYALAVLFFTMNTFHYFSVSKSFPVVLVLGTSSQESKEIFDRAHAFLFPLKVVHAMDYEALKSHDAIFHSATHRMQKNMGIDWKDNVQVLLDLVKLIIINASDSSDLVNEEIQLIEKLKLWKKVVIVNIGENATDTQFKKAPKSVLRISSDRLYTHFLHIYSKDLTSNLYEAKPKPISSLNYLGLIDSAYKEGKLLHDLEAA